MLGHKLKENKLFYDFSKPNIGKFGTEMTRMLISFHLHCCFHSEV